MSFDYPYTCPSIDRSLQHVTSSIDDLIHDLTTNLLATEMSDDDRSSIVDYVNELGVHIEGMVSAAIEEVRETNISMRDSADKQCDELRTEISDLETQCDELSREISDLGDEINAIHKAYDE